LPIAPNLFMTALSMLKELSTTLLCGFAIAGQMRAQEVVVTRDAKSNPSERVAPVSEGTGSESEAATEMKSQRREKKSAFTTLTLEQMRMAGALAAQRQKKQTAAEQTSSVGRSGLQSAKVATLAERQKIETRVEQANAHRVPTAHTANWEAIGPVRPTMLEAEKQELAASHQPKTEVSGGQTNVPQLAKRIQPVVHYSYKTQEGKNESVPVITHYYPKRIVYPYASIDRRIDGRLMQAATIAQERAHAHSRSMCWHYVKEALLASGVINSRPQSELARDAAQDLVTNYGFKKLPVTDPFAAPVGSVIVYGTSRSVGHVEFRTQDGFVSDFRSKTPSRRPLLGVYAKL
jgi:hypothetical protein